MASKVYFSDFLCRNGESRLTKLDRLLTAAGFDTLDFSDKFTAVKLHFGEWGNLAFLRQQYAKIVCDRIKANGGKPFLTDCNTLYAGYRNNALGHLDAAYMNGFNPLATGVHSIIADGLRGTDERLIPVAGGEYVKEAHIGSAIAESDVFISLTHFKGHIGTGFGGTMKNIGMGCGSKMGKMEMHSCGTPAISEAICVGCGMCVKNCAHAGVHVVNGKAVIDEDACVGCGHCFSFCPKGALSSKYDEAKDTVCKKIAEYAKAVLDGKPAFHISLVMDVSPFCDCDPGNDIAMIPDIGMFASFDPVALDRACADAANRCPAMPGSFLDLRMLKKDTDSKDIFRIAHPDTDWEVCLAHAEKLGLGTQDYELITI